MNRKLLWAALGLCMALTASGAWADQVVLKNGDRLSGEVLRMSAGKLVLKTGYAGEISIKWSEVASLATEKPLKVTLPGEKIIEGAASRAGQGKALLGSGSGQSEVVLSQVQGINLEDKNTLKIKGQVNLGMDIREGNTNKDHYDIDGRIRFRRGLNRFTVGVESHKEENKGKDTVDNGLASVEYNRFISPQWYAFGNLMASQDKFKDINLRTAAGGGMGYQVWQTPVTELSIKLGPNYIYEEAEDRGERDWFAARWALDFDYWLFDKYFQIFHYHEIFARVDDADQFFFNTRTGLRAPIRGGLVATVQYNYDWDNDPEPGKDEMDSRLLFKLGYHW